MFKFLKKTKQQLTQKQQGSLALWTEERRAWGCVQCWVLPATQSSVRRARAHASLPRRSCSFCPDRECPPLWHHKDETPLQVERAWQLRAAPCSRWVLTVGGTGKGSGEVLVPQRKRVPVEKRGPWWDFPPEATKFGLVPQTSYPDSYLGAS